MKNKRPLIVKDLIEKYMHDTDRLRASPQFLTYLRLSMEAMQIDESDNVAEGVWLSVNQRRDAAALKCMQMSGQSLQQVFEKLFIWRVDCMEEGADGFVYFNDLFPLSAYMDLKSLLGNPPICPPSDDGILITPLGYEYVSRQ